MFASAQASRPVADLQHLAAVFRPPRAVDHPGRAARVVAGRERAVERQVAHRARQDRHLLDVRVGTRPSAEVSTRAPSAGSGSASPSRGRGEHPLADPSATATHGTPPRGRTRAPASSAASSQPYFVSYVLCGHVRSHAPGDPRQPRPPAPPRRPHAADPAGRRVRARQPRRPAVPARHRTLRRGGGGRRRRPVPADMRPLLDRRVHAYGPLLRDEPWDVVWTVGGQVGSIDLRRAYRFSASPRRSTGSTARTRCRARGSPPRRRRRAR